MIRSGRWLAAMALVIAACSGGSADIANIPELPTADVAQLQTHIAETSHPVVVNVWASWCIPCRSEAPLLGAAAERFSDDVEFIGLNVRDSQNGARGFIAEFFPDAPIDHIADSRGNVPVDLGASRAVPITIFYAANGELSTIHTGVLDERTLAIEIDEILARP